MARLKALTLRGYKSICDLEDFELSSLNVLIGANGAGKSNFISVFHMLAELVEGRLQLFVQDQDGPDALLFGGRQRTPEIQAEFYFGRNGYRFALKASGEKLIFTREETWFDGDLGQIAHSQGSGQSEAYMPENKQDTFASFVLPAIRSWRVYHFHDTSPSAPVRQAQAVRDNLRLKADAGNLAAFIRRLRQEFPEYYQRITQTIRLAAPFFGDFVYRPDPGERVALEWTHKWDPDTVYGPRQLSDGSLRFIALATLLLQPERLQPDTMIIDEPELGLHPYALNLLAAILQQAAESRQLIVATQSVELVNSLSPEHIVVVDQQDGESIFKRLVPEELAEWLQDYRLGELWNMNILGGRPTA